jgi:5'-methylthioadenosine phosphorylase
MLAIIGGSGLYQLEDIDVDAKLNIDTPFGSPSAPLVKGNHNGCEIIFLPRHGNNHELLPHEINYRANIWALKSVGVSRIVSVSAVGSLQSKIAPGDFVLADQYFDWVLDKRDKTFFGNGLVAHVAIAKPSCQTLADIITVYAEQLGIKIHTGKRYAGISGPRFGTKLESYFLKDAANCDVVGMTNIPEIFLAREAQICYCSIGVVTDYDSWQKDFKQQVEMKTAIERYMESLVIIKKLLVKLLMQPLPKCDLGCRTSLQNAVLSSSQSLTPEKKELLKLLMK